MSANYTVLARKYRSPDFGTLIGQDVLVKTLTTAINTARIAHAYIFTGIRGTGKTSTARILAKALNCLSSDKATATPCDKCENCAAIAAGQHIDVLELDAASHTGVDNMRELLEAAQYRPTNGRYKVYIIDEVHMLSTSAFNALLKTLEEPPAHVIFILATTEIRKVPVTILSRCQRFDLVRVPVEILKKHFAWIAAEEGVELSEDANELLARAADGSVRDGLSLLDQAIAQTGGKVDRVAVLDMLKRADRIVVLDFMKILLSGDTAVALSKSDELYQNGADLSLLLSDMMEWTHWMTRMHPSLRAGDVPTAPYSPDQRAQMIELGATTTLNTLSRLWQVMVAAVPEMAASGNQKQCFDMLVVRLMHVADMPPVDVLMAQGNNVSSRRAAQSDASAGPGQNQAIKNISDNKHLDTVKTDQVPHSQPAVALRDDTVINTIMDLTTALTNAKEILLLSALNNNIEVSSFEPGHIKFFNRRGDKDFAAKLGKWLFDNTGMQWQLEQLMESENTPTASEGAVAAAASDPMVANAMDLFAGAEIVKIN
ncbi:MAG: DNA polymerase III subunit gamma/tau [Alphaproteobacteria bacterium]|nr:DNA polymerase III subunit gamma/tau [Alphaproteobacteria bacterium]